MCGIVGALGRVDGRVLEAVERATLAMLHRGPDAEGSFAAYDDRGGVVLGHRRLSILDLSEAGNQPMRHRHGLVIAYNGEIYNFRELRAELRDLGHDFVSDCDTEVVLAGWCEWGPAVIERLRGMFAFALWDSASRTLHLVRDRFGKKPLYVAHVEHDGKALLLFASELRALLATGFIPRRLDKEGFGSYLWHGFVVSPRTMVQGVRLVAAATHESIELDSGAVSRHRYWTLPRATQRGDAVDELRAELDEAVRIRLVSDVPLGVFLSGGIDSSAITAIAARLRQGELRTFCIGFDDGRHDEAHHARAVARALGTQHQELRLNADRFAFDLPAALSALDQPTFDAINTYFVSRLTKESGITVALSGAGGDELFGGYASFRDLPRALPFTRLAGLAPGGIRATLARALASIVYGPVEHFPPQTRWAKLEDLLDARGRLLDAYQVVYGLFTRATLTRLSSDGYPLAATLGLPHERYDDLSALVAGQSVLHGVSLLEISSFLGERLLRDTDTASMAVSLEVRLPLLDHRVVETVSAVGSRRRYHPIGRKQLLRDLALGDLDSALFERPKSGFVLPLGEWCRTSLAGEIDRSFADEAKLTAIGLAPTSVRALWSAFRSGAEGLYWSRLWAIYVVVQWCERHGVTAE